MTPLEFAEAFDLPLDAVLTWEAYGTVIDLTAMAYLRVIEQDPEGVRAALARSR
jgi:DNA-binding transcriptional regulator YiaG